MDCTHYTYDHFMNVLTQAAQLYIRYYKPTIVKRYKITWWDNECLNKIRHRILQIQQFKLNPTL